MVLNGSFVPFDGGLFGCQDACPALCITQTSSPPQYRAGFHVLSLLTTQEVGEKSVL